MHYPTLRQILVLNYPSPPPLVMEQHVSKKLKSLSQLTLPEHYRSPKCLSCNNVWKSSVTNLTLMALPKTEDYSPFQYPPTCTIWHLIDCSPLGAPEVVLSDFIQRRMGISQYALLLGTHCNRCGQEGKYLWFHVTTIKVASVM